MDDLNMKFQEKIKGDYKAYINELMTKDKEELINLSEEISAVRQIYKALKSDVSMENHQLEYLLRFKHPLMVIHDQCLIMENDLSYALETLINDICDKRDIEQDYPMEDDLMEPKQEGVQMC
jgi:molybdopterin converting factor small subunit